MLVLAQLELFETWWFRILAKVEKILFEISILLKKSVNQLIHPQIFFGAFVQSQYWYLNRCNTLSDTQLVIGGCFGYFTKYDIDACSIGLVVIVYIIHLRLPFHIRFRICDWSLQAPLYVHRSLPIAFSKYCTKMPLSFYTIGAPGSIFSGSASADQVFKI